MVVAVGTGGFRETGKTVLWSSSDPLMPADRNSLGSAVTVWGIVYVYVRLQSDVYSNKQTNKKQQAKFLSSVEES